MIPLSTAYRAGAAIVASLSLVATLTLQAQQGEPRDSHGDARSGTDLASCLKQAAQMNAAVTKFGQLASEKAQNPELKQFGEQLERDHKQAQAKLDAIARKHDVVLPTSLDARCQEEVSKLQGLSGREFDREFAKGAVQGHAMAIAKLEKESGQTKDSDVAQYMKDMLSQVKRHQEKAREVAKAVGLDQATIAALETERPQGVGTSGASSETEGGNASSSDTGHSDAKDSPHQP
jgi:putative membrane protein